MRRLRLVCTFVGESGKVQTVERIACVDCGYQSRENYLATRKPDGYYPKLIAGRQKLGGNCGRRSHCCVFFKSG